MGFNLGFKGLTAIGLSPGGSTHLHTNNTQNNTNNNQYDPGNSTVPQSFEGMQCFHLLELRCPGTMQNTAKGYGILHGYLNP